MIIGKVNARREIRVCVELRDSGGSVRSVMAILDTGFNGALTLPRKRISDFGLPWISKARAILADGSVVEADVHAATLFWDGGLRQALVQVAEGKPLLGMALLMGFDLRARLLVGGRVELDAVP